MIGNIRYANSTTRPTIKTSLYQNVYAALGMEPTTKGAKNEMARGQSMEEVLVFLMNHVRLDDGTTFEVHDCAEKGFPIVQVL